MGGERSAEETAAVSTTSRTVRAPPGDDWRERGRRDGDGGPDKVDGKAAAGRVEWRHGVDNSSFDDDSAYLSLIFASAADVDTPSAAVPAATDGHSSRIYAFYTTNCF